MQPDNPAKPTFQTGVPASPTQPPGRPDAAPGGSLRQRAKRGAIILVASQMVGQVMRLGGNLVLTRLLVPEAFGLMTIVNIFLSGIQMFSDVGIKPSIVQNKMGNDRRFLDTAWTIQVIRGFGIFIVACLLAYPVAYLFYDLPILAWMLPVAALTAVIFGFESTKVHTASRNLQLGREMSLQLGAQAAGIGLMALIAYLYFYEPGRESTGDDYSGAWALVIGMVLMALIRSGLSHVVFPGKCNRFAWDRECLGELISFGKWIFLGTVVMFLANNMDRLLLSKFITPEMLGVYQIAFMLTNMPTILIRRFGNKVVFPAVSRRADMDRAKLNQKLQENQKRLALVMAVPVIVLVCAGDWIVQLGWDDRYLSAGWMTSVLGFGLWVAMLRATVGPALLAIGKPQYQFYGNIGRLVWSGVVAGGVFLLLEHLGYNGLPGFIVAFTLAELPAYAITAWGIAREKLTLWRQDLVFTGLLFVALAVILGGRYALGGGLPFTTGSG